MSKAVEILDRGTVEGKIRHYQEVVSDYESKYSGKYETLEKSVAGKGPSSEIEDDLLDWKEALLMLSIYERVLLGLTN
ncbi:MAG: hypothetical protein ACLP05_08895 [Candidatus Kryptoniota bacterium]